MTNKWEYKEVFIGNGHAEDILNQWAKAGWELILINGYSMYAYFKKKV